MKEWKNWTHHFPDIIKNSLLESKGVIAQFDDPIPLRIYHQNIIIYWYKMANYIESGLFPPEPQDDFKDLEPLHPPTMEDIQVKDVGEVVSDEGRPPTGK